VTLAAYAFMAYLFVSELWIFMSIDVEEKMRLDESVGSSVVPVNLEVDFFELNCGKTKLFYRGLHHAKLIEDFSDKVERRPLFNERGCKIKGVVMVKKVEGILEVSAKDPKAFNEGSKPLNFEELRNFNASHRIVELSFAERVPGAANVLNGMLSSKSDGIYQFQYQVKAVPTKFFPLRGKEKSLSQYSATHYFKKCLQDGDPDSMFGLMRSVEEPGFFVRLKFSSIVVEKKEVRRSFLHFLTNVCAIVGGVYAAAELLDTLLHHTILAKKMD